MKYIYVNSKHILIWFYKDSYTRAFPPTYVVQTILDIRNSFYESNIVGPKKYQCVLAVSMSISDIYV